jgi:hypothetical protein
MRTRSPRTLTARNGDAHLLGEASQPAVQRGVAPRRASARRGAGEGIQQLRQHLRPQPSQPPEWVSHHARAPGSRVRLQRGPAL